jgi:hypothetical protein
MAMMRSTKFQAPNNKQIPITKIRKSKQDCSGHLNLELGYYLEFGFWDLEFCRKINNNRR